MSKLQNNNDKGSAKNHRTDEAMQSDVVVNLKKRVSYHFPLFAVPCQSMPNPQSPGINLILTFGCLSVPRNMQTSDIGNVKIRACN